MIVPLMNDPIRKVSEMCCEVVRKLLKQDKVGQASLAAVKVISGVVKSRNYDVKPEDLTDRESLHCILTSFHILSGQGDVLNIDPLKFYSHLYKTLLTMHAGGANEDIAIVLQCLAVMLTKRREQVTLQRAQAFVKRLSMLSLHVLPDSCMGILAANRTLMHGTQSTANLL
ncbi:nucleolar complex protein 3 homolog [Myxocyprinus asiaticus]|uniref:nucleolar complex protein 3 homolog n=1 Tax=Myxocyprinus asiaticus TaxID=70543 RepID=UPI0022224792|nr:nucleolar complex protein 3 homolog [Myxocyprinus asiaticus]